MRGWEGCPDCWGSGHVKGWGAKCEREEVYQMADTPCGINLEPCLPTTYDKPCAWDFTSLLAEHSKGCSNTQHATPHMNPADCEECLQELMSVMAKRLAKKVILDYLAELTRRAVGLP